MTNKSILSIRRKRYYAMIWEYKRRRITVMAQAKSLTKKIKVWKREIERVDEKTKVMQNLLRAVKSFTGVSILNKDAGNDENIQIAKSLYFKTGLESGMRAVHLMEFIGVHHKNDQATRYRKAFTNSLNSNLKNKETWTRFKRYYQSQQNKIP